VKYDSVVKWRSYKLRLFNMTAYHWPASEDISLPYLVRTKNRIFACFREKQVAHFAFVCGRRAPTNTIVRIQVIGILNS